MKLILKSLNHGNVEIPMHKEEEVLSEKESTSKKNRIYVYNDYEFLSFSITGSIDYVSDFCINDETVQIKRIASELNSYQFVCEKSSEKNGREERRIFMQCFGIVQIKIKIAGRTYVSGSISIMVADNNQYQNIIKMIEYIYDKGEDYLYENYISLDSSNESNDVNIESQFALLDETIDIYEQFFRYFQNSPKKRATSGEIVGKFYKLDSVTPKTIQYIASHPEELYEVDFNTGISYGKRHFQPENTLISNTVYTTDVYENRIVTGFLSTLISELQKSREKIKNSTTDDDGVYRRGKYFESERYIFSTMSSVSRIRKIDEYIEHLHMLWLRYSGIFNAEDVYIDFIPEYTDTFRLVMPYRAVYEKIYEWRHHDGHSAGKKQLLESFRSTKNTTSTIYEYYCLIKMLVTLREEMNCILIDDKTEKFEYTGTGTIYQNTYCNNTFFFLRNDGTEITLYFQPVIYGDIPERPNDIMLYRNRLSIFNTGNKTGNIFYTPDYLIKVTRDGLSKYVIMDAKYSSVQTVENDRLIELVYKYLFSVSTVNADDTIDGMVIICGKDAESNKIYNLHDISEKMNKSVKPFSYIMNLSGVDTSDNSTIREIITQILE